MTTFHEWAGITLALLIVVVALVMSAIRVRTRNLLNAHDAEASAAPPVDVRARSAAAAAVVAATLTIASLAPVTLPETWRSVGVMLALFMVGWPTCLYVVTARHRPWLLVLPFVVLGLEALAASMQLELLGAVLLAGAVLPLLLLLTAMVHPSMSKRAAGIGEGGVFGGHEPP